MDPGKAGEHKKGEGGGYFLSMWENKRPEKSLNPNGPRRKEKKKGEGRDESTLFQENLRERKKKHGVAMPRLSLFGEGGERGKKESLCSIPGVLCGSKNRKGKGELPPVVHRK